MPKEISCNEVPLWEKALKKELDRAPTIRHIETSPKREIVYYVTDPYTGKREKRYLSTGKL